MTRLDTQPALPLPEHRLGVLVTLSLVVHLAIIYAWQPQPPELTLNLSSQSLQVTLNKVDTSKAAKETSNAIQPKTARTETTSTQPKSLNKPIKPTNTEPNESVNSATPETIETKTESESTSLREVLDTPLNEVSNTELSKDDGDITRQSPQRPETKDPQTNFMSMDEVNVRVISKLKGDIHQYFNYPLMAKKRGWEGEVHLDIEVTPQGEIANVVIRQSSGYTLLDKAALNSIKRIGHINDAVKWLAGRHLSTTIPVIYKLTNS